MSRPPQVVEVARVRWLRPPLDRLPGEDRRDHWKRLNRIRRARERVAERRPSPENHARLDAVLDALREAAP